MNENILQCWFGERHGFDLFGEFSDQLRNEFVPICLFDPDCIVDDSGASTEFLVDGLSKSDRLLR